MKTAHPDATARGVPPFSLPAGRPVAERNSRVQEQTISMKRVGEDLVLVSQRLEAEKTARWVLRLLACLGCLVLRLLPCDVHA